MNTVFKKLQLLPLFLIGGCLMLLAPLSAYAQVTLSGTVYENDGVTPLTGVATVTAAVATATPSLHSVQIGSGGATDWMLQEVIAFDPVDTWSSVTYGNGLFVAVGVGDSFGGGNRIATSPDGITWTARTTPDGGDTWYSVTYGNGLFVAVGDGQVGSEIMTSPDGITWTARNSIAGSGRLLLDVTYGNGLFVAVGSDTEVILTSTNGTTWTEQYPPDGLGIISWNGVTYGNGLFVAVAGTVSGISTAAVLTSPDGVTWTARSAAGNNDSWSDVTYGSGRFVAVGAGPDRVMTSTNGIDWTASSVAGNNDSWSDITYGGGLFVAVGLFGGSSDDYLLTSPDGITWTSQDVFEVPLIGIGYGNGLYVAVTSGGAFTAPGASSNFTISGIATSTGATDWTVRSAAGDNDEWQGITYGNGLFVAVGGVSAQDRVMTSPDGVTWTARSAAGNNDSWTDVVYAGGQFVAVGYGGDDRVMTSPDGVTWTARSAAGNNDSWNAITYGNGLYVVVGEAGDRVMTSPDGVTWTARSAAGNDDFWSDVTYGNGLFVAVGNSPDRVMTSPDGITWTARSAAGNNDQWEGVGYGNGLFVAVGTGAIGGDYVMTSPDGVTWTARSAAGNNDFWFKVLYANGLFVAVGQGPDRVMTSPDGITWTARSAAGNNDTWQNLAYGKGQYVVVGSSLDRVMTAPAGFGEDTPITLFLNNGVEKAASVTYGPAPGSSNLSGLNLQTGAVRLQSASSTIDLGRADFYDSSSDSDIHFLSQTGTTTIGSAATATDMVVATEVIASQQLVLYGDLTQNGTLSHGTFGITSFSGASFQLATGTLSGTSSFNNLVVANTSGAGSTTQSVEFGSPLTVRDTFTAAASSSVAFLAGATTTIQNLNLAGAEGSPIWLRSSEPDAQWYLDVPGSQLAVSYVDARDSGAVTPITASNSTDSGNNTNWNFAEVGDSTWNDTEWTNYEVITIASSQIDATLTDFPVYVNLAHLSSAFWDTVRADGGDIRITTNSGSPVELPREVVSINTSTDTGELHFKANSLSSSANTSFRIYTNGTTAGYADDATFGAQNVWTNGYIAVYHLEEDGNTTSFKDSTGNGNTGAPQGIDAPDRVAGQIGNGLNTDGTPEGVTIADNPSFNWTTGGISGWLQTDTLTVDGTLASRGSGGSSEFLLWFDEGVDDLTCAASINNVFYNGSSGGTYSSKSAGQWLHGFCNWDGTTLRNYVNGVSNYSTSAPTGSIDNDPTTGGIGREGPGARYLDGRTDEVRFHGTARSAAWAVAEYRNQSTPLTFYSISAPLTQGSSTIASHDEGRVANAFNFQNKTNEELFSFKLIPESGTATVTELTLTLSGVTKVQASDFNSIRLLRDFDNDNQYDATDVVVGGTGVMSIDGAQGTIVFTEDFLATTTQNYLVVANWNAPDNGSFVRISLEQENIKISDDFGEQIVLGQVSAVQHHRNNRGGGGASVQDVGGSAPTGDGVKTGGQEGGGGEQIGDDPNFRRPTTASGAGWTNPQNAYDRIDGTYATTNGTTPSAWQNHGFGINPSNSILGIAVRLEVSATVAIGTISVQLSYDGGTSWTETKSTPTLTTTDAVVTLGGATDLWGRSWSAAQFSDENFRVRLTGAPSGNTLRVDEIQVRVYHQSGGGGGGGGADI